MSNRPPDFYVSSTAFIGDGTRVWHYAVILDDVVIGSNCSIGSHAEIGKGTTIGDGSRISYGVFIPYHSRIGRNVFIGPSVTFTDDKYPRVNNPDYNAQPPVIEDEAAIGAGSVILPGVHIGHHALIGAGSVVCSNVAPYQIVHGQPARPTRFYSAEPAPALA